MPAPKTWEQHKEECQSKAESKGYIILGWVGDWKGKDTKLKMICPIHGTWETTTVASFKKGTGCPTCKLANLPKNRAKTWEQHKDEIQRIADSKQIQTLGYAGEWKGVHTKLDLSCHCGNRWQSTSINNFKRGKGCPKCKHRKTGLRSKVNDEQHVEEFMQGGKYIKGTLFRRSNCVHVKDHNIYWDVFCPVCNADEYVKAAVCSGWFRSTLGNLKKGIISCRCSVKYKYTTEQWVYRIKKICQKQGDEFISFVGKPDARTKFKYLCCKHGEQTSTPANYLKGHGCPGCAGKNQRELYINLISDESGSMYAAKLGIAKDSDVRLKGQNRANNHTMKRALLFLFDVPQDCKDTEQYLKHHVPSIGYVPDLHMKDGSTETFALDDLDYVVQTIKQRGGVLQEENYVY